MAGPFDPNTGMVQTTQQYYNADTTGTSGQTGTTNQQQANQYTPGQQELQSQLPQTLMGLLTGQTQAPGWMTAPPEAFKAYNDSFDTYVKPGLAFQYGAGSPQIGSQQMMGNEQLAANLYQNGYSNFLNGLGNAENFAMTPIGQNTNNQVDQDWQSHYNTSGYSGDNIMGSILNKLVSGLKF